MKVFIALACLCVCAQASLLPAATIATKLISTGGKLFITYFDSLYLF